MRAECVLQADELPKIAIFMVDDECRGSEGGYGGPAEEATNIHAFSKSVMLCTHRMTP